MRMNKIWMESKPKYFEECKKKYVCVQGWGYACVFNTQPNFALTEKKVWLYNFSKLLNITAAVLQNIKQCLMSPQ